MIDQREGYQFSEAHYQIAMEAAGVGMWYWDLRTNQHIWSKECKALLGLPLDFQEDFSYFASLIHPDDRERVFSLFEENYRTRSPHNVEYRIILPDGSLRWIADRGRFLYDEQGRAVLLTGVTWDITARKRAEEAVEQKQAFLQTIMQQAPSGMVIAEAPLGKITGYNEEASQMLGHQVLENRDYADYAKYGGLHADGTPYKAEEYPLARALTTGEVIKQESMLYRRPDGRLIHLEINAAPIYDAHGKIQAAIITFHDVSERYELEQRKDEFIRLASHELRTPLTSLKGNLQLTERRLHRYLKDESQLAEREKALLEQLATWNERALRQANVESRLVNDLLDANSLQTEGLRVSLEAGNLVQIARETIEDMQTVAQPRTLFFVESACSDLPVMADRVRIGQVITNYVKNALKYASEQKPVTVGISLECDQARVWVRDAGPGLSSEQQRYIWERFRQAPGLSGNEYPGGGLGLGLYICQELIRLHGGQTGVESAPGQGSTFWFIIPRAQTGSGPGY